MKTMTAPLPIPDHQDVVQDRLLDGHVLLTQPRQGYRVAIDPVFLAAFLPLRPGQKLLDAGCGVGAVLLCLLHRQPDLHIVGLEREDLYAQLARKNSRDNGHHVPIVQANFLASDIQTTLKEALAWEKVAFDHIVMNPPYLESFQATASPSALKNKAHIEEAPQDLARWIGTAHKLLRFKGQLSLIHRADRLPQILAALTPAFGDISIVPLWPQAHKPAKRILISARRGVKSPAQMHPGLVLHHPDGRFTDQANHILRSGQGMCF